MTETNEETKEFEDAVPPSPQPKTRLGKLFAGCLTVCLMGLGVFGLVLIGILIYDYATEDPEVRAQRKAQQEATAKAAEEAEEAKKRAQGLHCVHGAGADSATGDDATGPWSCNTCWHPGIDAAIEARLRASSSYDRATLAWGKAPLGFDFMQGFTAENVYGVTLDYRAKGTFGDKNCKVLSIEIVEGRGF